ncbi:MAG: AarF/ABC1/UbiB kinase family protein [Bdellovibrionota bacterium]
MSKIPKGIFSRSVELLKLATKVGSEELLSRTDAAARQMEQAKALVDSLGRLKGAAMKVGQLLSMDFSDLFPPEVRQVLEQLQSNSPHFMDESEVREILQAELPEEYAHLEALSAQPVAAASIGQVHSAKWRGKDVVLKIQYPGVSDSIDSDMALLKGVVHSLVTLSRKKMNLDPLFEEFVRVFKSETDYEAELKNLNLYREKMRPYENEYRCPEAYPELSSKKVLGMSFEKGVSLKDWIREFPSMERREKMGKRVLNLYTIEFFENAFVQSDPNPANFMVDSNDRIILLDFGAMKSFSPEFVTEYTALMAYVGKKDLPASTFQAEKMNFLSSKEKEETKELFYHMLRSSLCAFDSDKQPFDFNDKDYFEGTKVSTRTFGKAAEYSPPPHEIIFLHRKLVGVFGILRDLGLKLDLSPYWKKVTSKDSRS